MSLLNRKILFVHINKSCGGIITQSFKKMGKVEIINKHRCLNDMLKIVKQKNIDINSLFIFTIVRNPWERMLSMFLYYGKKYKAPEFYSGNKEIDNDFNKWIEYIYSDEFDKKKKHSEVNIFKYCFSNQLNWIKDENGKLLENTHMYKIEDLDMDDFFKNTLNLSGFVNQKVHPTQHAHYSTYYNQKSIKLVEEHYMDDIVFFNYRFDYN